MIDFEKLAAAMGELGLVFTPVVVTFKNGLENKFVYKE